MGDIVWKHLEDVPGQSAAWIEWKKELGKWTVFDKFHKKYLHLCQEKADEIDCENPCGEGCARIVVEHSRDNVVAVCPEGRESPHPISYDDILIYSLKRHEFHKELCAIFNFEHRESRVNNCVYTWRIGDFVPASGMVFPAYISFSPDRECLSKAITHIYSLHGKFFIIICPTRKNFDFQAEQLLSQNKALFISLEEELFFDAEGKINAHRNNSEIFASLLNKNNEEEPENCFYQSGEYWEIKYQGGEKILLKSSLLGIKYLHFMLGHPGTATPITEIIRKFSVPDDSLNASRRLNPEEDMNRGSIAALPSGGSGVFADTKALHKYHEELKELRMGMEEAKASGNNAEAEFLQKEIDNITQSIREAIGPSGQKKFLNDPAKKMSNSFRNAVNKAIDRIDKYDSTLAEHLKLSFRGGIEAGYFPADNIEWTLQQHSLSD